ncbi:hypothetical protein NDU88_003721 [Pleurodeles waltl]|uniref:Uncharacterized protein n=1 Tax=Pleurodeles waltl TaxID=8319 RepID=A0AAV7W7S5_PLEWA|nr:hypothetical protein NDU88_003721 [Pleurodeles waltl]
MKGGPAPARSWLPSADVSPGRGLHLTAGPGGRRSPGLGEAAAALQPEEREALLPCRRKGPAGAACTLLAGEESALRRAPGLQRGWAFAVHASSSQGKSGCGPFCSAS